jgi:hypothetical protein
MDNMSSKPGYFTYPHALWGSTATSLAPLGGLMRTAELRAGHIDHALSMAIPDPRGGIFVWPAQRSDGVAIRSTAPPEGTHLRLDPNLDLNALPLSRTARMMAQAAQRYGIVIEDRGGCIAFYAEDPTPSHQDPYYGPERLFEGQSPAALLAQFPWSHLQVLAVPTVPPA